MGVVDGSKVPQCEVPELRQKFSLSARDDDDRPPPPRVAWKPVRVAATVGQDQDRS